METASSTTLDPVDSDIVVAVAVVQRRKKKKKKEDAVEHSG